MESWVPINRLLTTEITKVDQTLVPPGFQGGTQSLRMVQESIASIIDQLGELSAAAQGLTKVITTAAKLRSSPNFTLYLLKDVTCTGSKGEVIGMLKVGPKHLYLSDSSDKIYEVEPLCVLDFFVQRDRQRHGLGKKLFDHMLEDKKALPQHLAIDGPSPIMLQFLEKNYGMKDMIRNANNFAVAPAFFVDIKKISTSGCSTPAAVTGGVGRFTAHKPQSGIGKIIHGKEKECISVFAAEEEGGPAAGVEPPSPVETEAGDATPPGAGAGAGAGAVERPRTLLVETGACEPAAVSPAGSTAPRRDSQLTDQGFFNVKFYHNKLW